jgi:hypothetical protein
MMVFGLESRTFTRGLSGARYVPSISSSFEGCRRLAFYRESSRCVRCDLAFPDTWNDDSHADGIRISGFGSGTDSLENTNVGS